MKRLILLATVVLCVSSSWAQGLPFVRNYMSKDYEAHNRNFDVVAGDDGTVYFANFEGLLYYDNVQWRIIHNPGITRFTVVYCDNNGTIWTGGYKYFGRIVTKPNGELQLKQVGESLSLRGEVVEIWENDGELLFVVSDGKIYKVDGDQIELKREAQKGHYWGVGLSDVISQDALDNDGKVEVLDDITQTIPLENGLKASVKKGEGLIITDSNDHELYTITETNGLCSNNIVWIAYDGHGHLWGATDNGVFSLAIPSAITRFSASEGLDGEVLSIEEHKGKVFVGTSSGLYYQEGMKFVRVPGIHHACWALSKSGENLLAATANGIYRVSDNNVAVQVTIKSAMSLLEDGPCIYSGEIDGVFLYDKTKDKRKKVCALDNVTKIIKDKEGTIWVQNTYGMVWRKQAKKDNFQPYKQQANNDNFWPYKLDHVEDALTIVQLDDKVVAVSAISTTPIPYPLISYQDENGVTWLTDNKGKMLYRWKDGNRLDDMDKLLSPIGGMTIHSMMFRNNILWLGDENGLTVINTKQEDPALQTAPRLILRSVVLNGDSILWGGHGTLPEHLPDLSSNDRNLRFTYSVDFVPMIGSTKYRYRLNNDNWSTWEEDNDAEFLNLSPGSYTFSIQALLPNGEMTEVVSTDFSIAIPFYARWYMNLLYILLAILLVYAILRYRLHRLNQEKIKLEKIVQERTAEVVKQKDEIEEKSQNLEKALDELGKAQHELIRQEKMATVGKLTQGLIDRILNPLNYINNFSKLSEGLVKDIEANIEDDKDSMNSENYEDTMDVLSMLRGNLQKVGEHGQNTTRTLKAMEEMLKDRSGGIVPMDLVSVLRQDEKMLANYYADDIRQYGIKATFDIPQDTICINGNGEQLSKAFMSIIGNAVYAVVKKAQREQYKPEVTVSVTSDGTQVTIVIRDNGIGIEQTIIDKIFDPFFTTKTTGEAAGVGLYLTHEIVQNHKGSINVKSEKNIFTEFIITLPIS